MPRPPQTLKNHRRYFALYHYFAFPVATLYALYATWQAIRGFTFASSALAAFAWAVVGGLLAARTMALRVQDRVIRLEETIRLHRVLPAERQSDVDRLSTRQLIALRFASDDELPELARRTLTGELASPQAIKEAIRAWRPDWLRA